MYCSPFSRASRVYKRFHIMEFNEFRSFLQIIFRSFLEISSKSKTISNTAKCFRSLKSWVRFDGRFGNDSCLKSCCISNESLGRNVAFLEWYLITGLDNEKCGAFWPIVWEWWIEKLVRKRLSNEVSSSYGLSTEHFLGLPLAPKACTTL